MSSGEVIEMGEMSTSIRDAWMQNTVSRRERLKEEGVETPTVVTLAELEKRAILTTIEQVKGDKLLAARLLNIGKTTLYRKLKEYGETHERPTESH
jgi:two-component system response regulator HydG